MECILVGRGMRTRTKAPRVDIEQELMGMQSEIESIGREIGTHGNAV